MGRPFYIFRGGRRYKEVMGCLLILYFQSKEGEGGFKEVMGRLLLPLLFVGFASPSSEVSWNLNPQKFDNLLLGVPRNRIYATLEQLQI